MYHVCLQRVPIDKNTEMYVKKDNNLWPCSYERYDGELSRSVAMTHICVRCACKCHRSLARSGEPILPKVKNKINISVKIVRYLTIFDPISFL